MIDQKNNNDKDQKQEALKGIIKKLHDGVSVDDLKRDFAKIIKNTSPEEIADMENALIKEGFPPEEIQRLCDVHVQVFEKTLKKVGKSSKIPGHPIYTFVEENKVARKILKQMVRSVKKFKKGAPKETDRENFKEFFSKIKDIEKHYQRKENQLFPMLEAKQFSGPTKVMWGKHDEIREKLRNIDKLLLNKSWTKIPKEVSSLSTAIKKLIFLEEKILYPTSARKLDSKEWAQIKIGGPEIGYAWVTPSNVWDSHLVSTREMVKQNTERESVGATKKSDQIKLSQGQLTKEQINLLLKNLPVDITFVDENDKVLYYSDTSDRIFPRSSAIIGREVLNCHPHKSIKIVQEILQSFKEKKREVAEFWIKQGEKIIYIRYFPLYNDEGEYKGVIEVSQEISNIKKISGEKRLLDW